MRASLPIMVIASVAAHLCVAAGVALSYCHWPISHVTAPDALPPLEMVLHSEEIPAPLAPSKFAPIQPAVTSQPIVVPPVTVASLAKSLADTVPPVTTSPAPEINPNAHVKVLPPEAVLSPTPPPQLNAVNGVVFVLDISGSMYESYNGSTRLGYARQALSQRILALKEGTPFAIILYALKACASGPLVAARDETRKAAVRFILRDVDCGGGTNLPVGLSLAAQLRTGNIVVVSDGDLNSTAYSLTAKARTILGPEGHCPALTVVAVAPRLKPGDDRLLQTLADAQGGTYVAQDVSGGAPLLTSADGAVKPAAQ